MPQTQVGAIQIFDQSAGDTAPDSVTIAGDFLFVAYANNVASDGTGPGTSEIVQYDLSGHIVHTYDITGSVDGLKFDPVTEKLWALQNQDGNSTLTIIDPETHHVSSRSPMTILPRPAATTMSFSRMARFSSASQTRSTRVMPSSSASIMAIIRRVNWRPTRS